MEKTCDDTMGFSGEFDRVADCEYLLTVNVAQCIAADFGVCMGEPYKIFLEHPTSEFASACVPLFKRAGVGLNPKTVLRGRQNSSRNGRIDIAVYDNMAFGTPVCAIELKGFNPSKQAVIADLKRNAEYLELTCETGGSKLRYAFFGALHKMRRPAGEEQYQRDIGNIRAKYDRWISSMTGMSNLTIDISAFTVSSSFDEVPVDPHGQYFELEAHHFVGIVVTLERN